MTLQKINTRNTIIILMIVAAGAFRLVSARYPYVLSNFSPIGAMALFGGAYFTDKWKAYVVPLIALFVSDIFLNHFYSGSWQIVDSSSIMVYVFFIAAVFMGTFIKKASILNVTAASLLAVVLHWLLTDLPLGNLYPHTFVGYGQSLVAAIPFEKNMLFGDLVFCAILFGGFELAKSKYTALRANREIAL
ncbi:DUF6580 family putative transport protein [Mucilaginibacter ginsenosidivorans]|uniref:Uncharacterized protein n=1 Tax=Mucilaginibacter ginsenosidivorans TaxID=398053 RepID=A0A5B8V0V2_9SPHI|nr:DUF6580 family putative transport protein [Mucilaginibacter ginsenosidivorans]QEC64261.1 hypothetical protein FRZ54_17310 [Mucilaginibacter ginsenosidivorans]